MLAQRLNQRDRVFEGQAGSGTDRKVRAVRGIPEKNPISIHPVFAPQPWKLTPDRVIGQQWRAVQGLSKQLRANLRALLLIHRAKSLRCKTVTIALDDKGAHLRRVPIVMRVEHSLPGTNESLRERLEGSRSTEPGEVIIEIVQLSTKLVLVGAAQYRIQSVSPDEQIGFLFEFFE